MVHRWSKENEVTNFIGAPDLRAIFGVEGIDVTVSEIGSPLVLDGPGSDIDDPTDHLEIGEALGIDANAPER